MKHYEKEFKTMIVGLLESGQPASQVAKDYGLNTGMIRRWKREWISMLKTSYVA